MKDKLEWQLEHGFISEDESYVEEQEHYFYDEMQAAGWDDETYGEAWDGFDV